MSHRAWFWITVVALPIVAAAVAFALWYRFGTLIVLPEPKTARVFVNGDEVGFTSRLKPGSYRVTVSAEGFVPHREELTIKSLQIKRLRPVLKPLANAKLVVADTVDFLSSDQRSDQFFYFNRQARALFRLRLVKGPDQRVGIENIPITPSALGDLTELAFAPDYSVAVIRNKEGTSGLYNFARYDLLHQEFKEFDRDSSSFVFEPEGKLIYHFYRPGAERSLVRSERSREGFERIFNLKQAGIEDARLAISPRGETLLLVGGGAAHLITITTKTLTKVSDGVSSGRFLDERKLLLTVGGELQTVPFEISKTPTGKTKELGKVAVGQMAKLGVRAEAAQLAVGQQRLIGVFEPFDSAQGRQFGSFELGSNRFLPLKLATDLPKEARNFVADSTGSNVLFIADSKLWWLEL